MVNEYQRELFGEFKEKKGVFKKIADKITQKRPKLYIHMPLENIVVAIIITIMCIIVAFALGVERGRRFAVAPRTQKEEELTDKKDEITDKKIEEAADREGRFTIQLISYRRKQLAEDEKTRLANNEVDAFIIPLGNWYQVCAGDYDNMEEAKEALKKFEKDYKGCFIRSRLDNIQ